MKKIEVLLTIPFQLQDTVLIDGDLKGIVTGVHWRDLNDYLIEVSWLHNGTSQSAWFHPWRLKDV